MDSKSAIFVTVGSLLVMAMYSPIMNFVSAETNCYTSGEKRVCITTFNSPMPTQSNRDILPPSTGVPIKALVLCDKDGTNCTVHVLDKVSVVTPEVKNAIQNAIKNAPILQEETQTNTNDSKDIGGMKSDKGITKSPIE